MCPSLPFPLLRLLSPTSNDRREHEQVSAVIAVAASLIVTLAEPGLPRGAELEKIKLPMSLREILIIRWLRGARDKSRSFVVGEKSPARLSRLATTFFAALDI